MNRRHFFALSLPVLLGGAASAQGKPTSNSTAPRVRLDISHAKTGDSSPQTIVVATDADVETYVAFLQVPASGGRGSTSTPYATGSYLRVTPHIEADGKITVSAEAQFGENDIKMTFTARVESGKKELASTMTINGVQENFYVTATILEPPLKI